MPTSAPVSKLVPVLDADVGDGEGVVDDMETGEGGDKGGLDNEIEEIEVEWVAVEVVDVGSEDDDDELTLECDDGGSVVDKKRRDKALVSACLIFVVGMRAIS